MAVHSYLLDAGKRLATGLDPEAMRRAVSGGAEAGTLWVDIEDPSPEETP